MTNVFAISMTAVNKSISIEDLCHYNIAQTLMVISHVQPDLIYKAL